MARVTLSDVCDKDTSKYAQKDLNELSGEYPVYGASGFIKKIDKFQQNTEYVAVVKDGAGIGRTMFLPAKSSVIGTLQYLLPKKNVVPKYLYYAVNSMHLEKYYTGATIPHIYFKDYQKEEFNLPELVIQEQIVKLLEKVEKIIELRKKQLFALDQIIKSRFVEMFGDPIRNPMKWEMHKLGELSTKINSGNTPKGGEQVYVDNGIMFFRSQNVWKNYLDLDDIAYIDAETHANMSRSSLKHGDILMTKTGRVNTENSSLGRAALYLGEDDAANVNGHVYFIRLKPEINNKFILRILVSEEYRDYIRTVCVGGIDKRQLNKNHIEDFPIIYPPIGLQNKFTSFVDQVDKLKFTTQTELNKMQTLYDSLLQKYFQE